MAELTMKERRKKWADALRVEQGRAIHRLRKRYCFCVLGIGCEVYRVETGNGEWIPGHDDEWNFFIGHSAYPSLMPPEVKEWYGLRGSMGGFDVAGEREYISTLSDDGKPWPEIADIIEAEPAGLFVN